MVASVTSGGWRSSGAILGALATALGLAGPARAATYTVDSAMDAALGTCQPAVDDDCSLRDAITASNGTAGVADDIGFKIPGPGIHTIGLNASLPTITDPVVIDGYTQGDGATANDQAAWTAPFAANGLGSIAVLRIEVDRNDNGGIVISGGGTTVRGLSIFDSPDPPLAAAITLQTAGGNKVTGNFIGLRANGAVPDIATSQQNMGAGVTVRSGDGNVIGGTLPADRNVISANSSNSGGGIRVEGGAHTRIRGNLIGTTPAGTAVPTVMGTDPPGPVPVTNGNLGGIWVNGFQDGADPVTDVLIGGAEPGAGNLISGNTHDGDSGAITVNLNSTTTEVTILGNRIGTDVTGTAALGNNTNGVYAASPIALGDDTGHGNLISGNCCTGVRLDGADHTIQGNRIGTNAAGTAALPNQSGISTRAGTTLIGGTTPGARNLISGNGLFGITGDAFDDNDIQGNYIGTDATGTAALGNGFAGIVVPGGTGNTIGGPAAGSDNVISGNGRVGVLLTHPGEGSSAALNQVLGNAIGTDATRAAAVPNGGPGVEVQNGGRNVIGRPGEGNTIAHNGGDGVLVTGEPGQFGSDVFENDGNSIRGNSIFSNGGLGIDLGADTDEILDDGDGVTQNDAGDGDGGNNELQNFPSLTAVTPGASTTVSGTLSSAPGATYKIDLYETAACDASGNGEAVSHLGSADVTTDGAGNASWTHTVGPTVAPGSLVTATATGPDGSTSELSACRVSVTAPAPATEQQPQAQLPQPQGTVCRDRKPPITTLRRAGVKLARDGKSLVLSGRSADHRDCTTGVARVDVSLARVSGRTGVNCRFIRKPNRYQLTRPKNCRRPTLFKATGTDTWTFTFPVRLKPGTYRVQARGTDKAKNKETPKKRRNIVDFEVR
jgi:hypothetical protein